MHVETLAESKTRSRKLKLDNSQLFDYVKFNGQVFEIRSNELYNLALDHQNGIEARAKEYGMFHTTFFSQTCLFCKHNRMNASELLRDKSTTHRKGETTYVNFTDKPKAGDLVIIEDNSVLEKTCLYESGLDIGRAGLVSDDDNRIWFYAEKSRCALDDALISYLTENGHLDKFKTDKPYNFRPLSDFNDGTANPKDFEVKRPLRYRIPGVRKIVNLVTSLSQ